ncbi:methyltransferase domain-containing protein [Patescibacteria group bacterium]|uniref:Class I SAM-dependent methyltransferase n=1 Tax=candidate division WWE3 bacterium TaxID=2053526 RepID=A0A928TXC5_UNCKA|nr:class I SAM-dependent methyltransferase [candidate division WWE3 bacterium]MCL4732604.1 methyltransferase domain-containing protein [Patescibacteria group bacterium]MDL1952742.1 class I SAM-dependent methyltransferase [Candidatus Uhrbacteria bacterium UHB]RIL01130.1 MAG: hypothetical protein DCC77_01140 [Candidatus Uhrbacteria bacterium]
MADTLRTFEDAYWNHWNQNEVFRHTQALAWLDASDGPVVDIGCGDGFFLAKLREKGIEAWGTDISSTAIKHCHEKGLDTQEGDFAGGYVPERNAKTATALDVLEHLYTPDPLLASLHSRVETLIISVPNFASLPARLQVLFGRVPENNTPRKGHVYWYTQSVLCRNLEKNGWRIVAWGLNPPWMDKPIVGTLMKGLAHVWPSLFSLSFVVKAERV